MILAELPLLKIKNRPLEISKKKLIIAVVIRTLDVRVKITSSSFFIINNT